MEEKIKATDERYFVYQHPNAGLIFGKQEVRYQPSVDKLIFGTTKVYTYYPVFKELPSRFPLEMFPALNEEDPAKNIVKDPEEGLKLMYIEANKAAKLLACSILKIGQDKYKPECFRVMQISDVEEIDNKHPAIEGTTTYGVFMGVYGVITKTDWEGYDKKECFLRKGDIIRLAICFRKVNEEKPKLTWWGTWYKNKQPVTLKSRIMKFWYKLTDKKLYIRRYVNEAIADFKIPSECIRVIGKDAEVVG